MTKEVLWGLESDKMLFSKRRTLAINSSISLYTVMLPSNILVSFNLAEKHNWP